MIWKYFRNERPAYNKTILYIPSPQFGLLFAHITRMSHTDEQGDHFTDGVSRHYLIYGHEMWAYIDGPSPEEILG